MSFPIFDPTDRAVGQGFDWAPRSGLKNKVVGLLDNGKTNADVLLEALGRLLVAEQGAREVVRVRKPSPYRAAPEEVIEALAKQADLVVAGIGD